MAWAWSPPLFNEQHAQNKRDQHEGEHGFVPEIFHGEQVQNHHKGEISTNQNIKGEDHFLSFLTEPITA
jgi:hypothetical protein